MIKTKDFDFMKVLDLSGNYLGYVKDIWIDFNKGSIAGFIIRCKGLFSKEKVVSKEDILYVSEFIIVKSLDHRACLSFKDIKSMDIVDRQGNIIGILEDILIDIESFEIKGVIVCSGFLDRVFNGKRVLLIKDMMLGEDNILYFGNNESIAMSSLPHKIMGVDKNEKN